MVSSRLRFARIFIFNRKYKVPKFATDEKRRNVSGNATQTQERNAILIPKNMNKNILSCFVIILLISSCVKKEEKKSQNKSQIDSSNVKTTSGQKNNTIIDKSKLEKAFDDIYFGENNFMFKSHTKYYSIANMFFEVNLNFPNYEIDEKYGLYRFILKSGRRSDYKYCLDEINLINSVISKKYSQSTKITSPLPPKKYSSLTELERKITNPKRYSPPDDGYTNFLYKWNKNDVTIEVGIRTEYIDESIIKDTTQNAVFTKYFNKVIRFTSNKIAKQIEIDRNEMQKENEQKYSDDLKKEMEKDAKKFE